MYEYNIPNKGDKPTYFREPQLCLRTCYFWSRSCYRQAQLAVKPDVFDLWFGLAVEYLILNLQK